MISSVPGVAKTMATFERHLQSLLKHGKAEDLIARINCSPRFNMRNVLVTRDTLVRISYESKHSKIVINFPRE